MAKKVGDLSDISSMMFQNADKSSTELIMMKAVGTQTSPMTVPSGRVISLPSRAGAP